MSDLELLPFELKTKSISTDEIILDYDHAVEALDYFLNLGYATLGFEMIHKNASGRREIKNYVSYFPDAIVWEEFVKNAYSQVKDQMKAAFDGLIYTDIDENEVYFCLTFVNKQEFEDYYYEFVAAD